MLEFSVFVVSCGVFLVLLAGAYWVYRRSDVCQVVQGVSPDVGVERRSFDDDWSRSVRRSYLNPGEDIDSLEERAEAGFDEVLR